ncbi:MAG TPA: translation factor GTPase family protein [Streptosporangiaceae bacterium]|nr:translation factor GTPase family protein [Streptosporangiaceae bacterium]
MSRTTLNLGILAHVDAGKTTLTERLLYAAGVINRLGSVDAGTTVTDSLALERQRGITIKSAVASFSIGAADDLTAAFTGSSARSGTVVNLIDTPGHPDFIAEVDRVLSVLDGAVLVISAVEGVQPQTQILLRSLRRLNIPALVFVNKIDRPGARTDSLLREIGRRLKIAVVPMGRVEGVGTRQAGFCACAPGDPGLRTDWLDVLAERNDGLLAAYVDDEAAISDGRLRAELAAQTRRGLVYPVFFGSAMSGAGIDPLMAGIAELLPAKVGDPEGPVSGRIFKIERGASSEKVAYVRMFSGTIHARGRLRFGSGLDGKVTNVAVFDAGTVVERPAVSAGQIGKLWGLAEARIGDQVGELAEGDARAQFPPPTLESVVVPVVAGDKQRLRVALGQIAEQDPLINVRQDDERQEIVVSLYGEVQKDVIQSTLANDYGVAVTFRETTMIYVERPVGSASALAALQSDDHPYSATIGLAIEPGPADSGVEFRLDIDPRTIPLYIYKSAGPFADAMTRYVKDSLASGLYGWEVIDCAVTMNACDYYVGDGARKQVLPTPKTSSSDFRKLTPLVLRQALRMAGTVVCEPVAVVRIEVPVARMGAVLSLLAGLGADVDPPLLRVDLAVVGARLPTERVHGLQSQLPGLTRGEAAFDTSFGGYQPVHGRFPVR